MEVLLDLQPRLGIELQTRVEIRAHSAEIRPSVSLRIYQPIGCSDFHSRLKVFDRILGGWWIYVFRASGCPPPESSSLHCSWKATTCRLARSLGEPGGPSFPTPGMNWCEAVSCLKEDTFGRTSRWCRETSGDPRRTLPGAGKETSGNK